MSVFHKRIKSPKAAFIVIFLVSVILAQYGVIEGTCYLLAGLSGLLIYKIVTA